MTTYRPMRLGAFLLLGSTATCDAPLDPLAAAAGSLDLAVRVSPDRAIAGDTVQIIVTHANQGDREVSLRGRRACVLSTVDIGRLSETTPAMFPGSGAWPCAADATLTVPPFDSIELSRPLVLRHVPGTAESPYVDPAGNPLPGHYRVLVRSAALQSETETLVRVLSSGLYTGFGLLCEGYDEGERSDLRVLLRHEVILETLMRVRFQIRNGRDSQQYIWTCMGGILAVLDRRIGETWVEGSLAGPCAGGGWLVIPAGGCARGMIWSRYEPGEYRMRLRTLDGAIVGESAVVP